MGLSHEQLRGILQHCRDIDESTAALPLSRFDDDYFRTFDPPTVASHLQSITSLSADKPAAILLSRGKDDTIDCTIVAFDHPFEFSCIAGLMAGSGLSIERFDAFTLPRVKQPAPQRRRQGTMLRRRDPMVDAVIVDHLQGRLIGKSAAFKAWAGETESAGLEILRLLDQDDEASTERAKRLVNERVTRWLETRRRSDPRAALLVPVDAAIEQLPATTRLSLRAPDAPAFLYALSTALSLHGLEILKTRVQTIDGHAIDQIDLVDDRGKPVADPGRLQQLRLSVLLTQQFTYFLDRAPDPFTALRRFEELSQRILSMPQRDQWLGLLANPSSMEDLAKVLGASDYLWEDFIKLNAESLLPVFNRRLRGHELCPPARSLPRRLDEAIHGAKNFDEQRGRLNEFKDHELFLIDLEHILSTENPDATFQILSERLVLLAENLVATAAGLVFDEMKRLYGQPRDAKGNEVDYAIFGLGKLGGVALGYASDIELLFLFGADGRTSGGARGAMPNDEFFAIFTRETCDYLQAKREGIFQVDLRLRPYGGGGPLATSKEQFAAYYGPRGEAHPFERLALTRLRWVAGSSRLGFEIEQLRDKLLYEGTPPEVKAIFEITDKMRTQHLEGRKLNSKYTTGALTDLEATVQLLQVAHGREVPQLRTPRLQEALEGLRRGGIVSPVEFDELMGAYQFLRRLINAQRVLRGSAQDLFIPAESSDELIHLARRMNYVSNEAESGVSKVLLTHFQRHTDAVRRFMKKRLKR